jgi:FlaG/FlaF family flagellin (archaellin)
LLIRLDSFSYLDQDTITTNGGKFENWYALDANSLRVSATYGRNNGSGLRLITNSRTNGEDTSATVHIEDNYETMIVGIAVRVRSDDTSGDTLELSRAFNKHIISFLDGYLEQISLVVTPSGRLAVINGNSGAELGRSESFFLHDNVYYYLEMKAKISNTAGEVEVRADGVTVLSLIRKTRQGPTPTEYGSALTILMMPAVPPFIPDGILNLMISTLPPWSPLRNIIPS